MTPLGLSGLTITNGTPGAISGSGPFTIPVTPTGQGAVTCLVKANAVKDLTGNNNTISNNLSMTYDTIAPTCTIGGPASPTKNNPINFTATFSESVSGLTAANFNVTGGSKGTLNGSGAGPYTMPVTPSGQGTITCQVNAGVAQDAAGNLNTVSNNLSLDYDAIPSCTVSGPASPTKGSPINFIINFSEPVTGLASAGITVTNGAKGALSGSGAGPYTMPVTPTAQGAVTCKVNAGAAQDGTGNNNTISNTLSISYDTVAPTCTVTGPASPTKNNPINFTINFSESVSGLSAASINVTNGTKGDADRQRERSLYAARDADCPRGGQLPGGGGRGQRPRR